MQERNFDKVENLHIGDTFTIITESYGWGDEDEVKRETYTAKVPKNPEKVTPPESIYPPVDSLKSPSSKFNININVITTSKPATYNLDPDEIEDYKEYLKQMRSHKSYRRNLNDL